MSPFVLYVPLFLHRQPLCGVSRRKRGVEMLFGEQRQRLLQHWWFGVELGWRERVLWQQECNSADRFNSGRWPRSSAVCQWWVELPGTQQICLDRCPCSFGERLRRKLVQRDPFRCWHRLWYFEYRKLFQAFLVVVVGWLLAVGWWPITRPPRAEAFSRLTAKPITTERCVCVCEQFLSSLCLIRQASHTAPPIYNTRHPVLPTHHTLAR